MIFACLFIFAFNFCVCFVNILLNLKLCEPQNISVSRSYLINWARLLAYIYFLFVYLINLAIFLTKLFILSFLSSTLGWKIIQSSGVLYRPNKLYGNDITKGAKFIITKLIIIFVKTETFRRSIESEAQTGCHFFWDSTTHKFGHLIDTVAFGESL